MKKLAIYTDCNLYSSKLTDYLQQHVNSEYVINIFNDGKLLIEEIENKKISLLIVTENQYEELKKHIEDNGMSIGDMVKRIICLSEDSEKKTDENGAVYSYKFLPASEIVNQIISEKGNISTNSKSDIKCIITGIFSPIGGIGATSFSLAYAKERGCGRKVLYLNLKGFSPICESLYLDEEMSLSEAMYDYLSDKENKINRLNQYLQDADGFKTIAPFRHFIELSSVAGDMWLDFFKNISVSGAFDEIVLCLSEGVNDLFRIISNCNRVFILKREGDISNKKMELFDMQLKKEIGDNRYNSIVRIIDIPFFTNQEIRYESIETTDIGRWLRKSDVII